MTSLALALSLSEEIQLKGTAPLELFFLDEGFGSRSLSQRLCQQRNRMFAAKTCGHLNLPFAGFAVGDHQICAALFYLAEQWCADGL